MADTLSPLQKVAAVATLGTRRAPAPPADWPDASLGDVDGMSANVETRLLREAAALALWEGAGGRAAPAQGPEVPSDFPVVDAAPVAESAAWRLARIIGGEHAFLLGEWFELARARGRVLPAHFVPLVLEHVPAAARVDADPVLGPVARWLAAKHPRWLIDAPVTQPSDQRWHEGSTTQRVAELEALRRVDTARARGWLRATWDSDPPDAREAFILALLPTLEAGDEEFLEMALEDKRKAVRQAAVEGLARLPASAYVGRMIDRLAPLLELGPEPGGLLSKLRQRKLVIELPAAPDKKAQRDGIEVKPPAARKMGERAFWLTQMVSLVPPRHWCDRFACDAPTFLDAVLATDYQHEMLGALTLATARNPDSEWLLLLARTWITSGNEGEPLMEALGQLAGAARDRELDSLVEAVLRDAPAEKFGYASRLLEKLQRRWNATITELAIDRLSVMVTADRAGYSQPRNTLDDWAARADIATARARVAALGEQLGESHPWRNALERFNDIVAFRAAMQEELNQ